MIFLSADALLSLISFFSTSHATTGRCTMCLSMIPHQYWEHGTMAIPSEGCSGLEAFLAVGHVWCGPVSAIRELPAPCKQQLARQQQQCSPGTQCRQHLSHLGSSIQGPQHCQFGHTQSQLLRELNKHLDWYIPDKALFYSAEQCHTSYLT